MPLYWSLSDLGIVPLEVQVIFIQSLIRPCPVELKRKKLYYISDNNFLDLPKDNETILGFQVKPQSRIHELLEAQSD